MTQFTMVANYSSFLSCAVIARFVFDFRVVLKFKLFLPKVLRQRDKNAEYTTTSLGPSDRGVYV